VILSVPATVFVLQIHVHAILSPDAPDIHVPVNRFQVDVVVIQEFVFVFGPDNKTFIMH
jgi:hypothetical protein